MGPKIRPFAVADKDAVVDLSLKAWAPVFASIERELGTEVFRRQHPDWREDQRRTVEDACASQEMRVWVAESGTAVVGFVATRLHRESSIGEIYLLAVDPDHQGAGIGTALNGFALEKIKDSGMSIAMVETGGDPGHAAARRAYEKAGFVGMPAVKYFKNL